MEENKKMHEALLAAIKGKGAGIPDEKILQINKNLSETLSTAEVRNQ
jgi:hypothetical protein